MIEMNLVNEISELIISLAEQNCDGCKNLYSSFRNHTCYTDSWSTKVLYYFDRALQELNIVYSQQLLEQVHNNGPGFR